MRAIIPSCGFGTRVGMRPDQSKELLSNKDTGERLIDRVIINCILAGIEPVVLVREEKKDLIKYLAPMKDVITHVMKPGKEWADTVYKSQEVWADNNILILPDTRHYRELDTLINTKTMLTDLNTDVVLGLHKVDDPTKWCVYDPYDKMLIEKPKETHHQYAFGTIGFKSYIGPDLFLHLSQNNKYKLYSEVDVNVIMLKGFQDLTREANSELTYDP
jgi:dTDP-glucose pyrophosphorylase